MMGKLKRKDVSKPKPSKKKREDDSEPKVPAPKTPETSKEEMPDEESGNENPDDTNQGAEEDMEEEAPVDDEEIEWTCCSAVRWHGTFRFYHRLI